MAVSDLHPHQTVGLIGLGLVGMALAQRLLSAGFPCIGYDLRAEARETFVAAGGLAVDSPADVARSACAIVLAVFDTHDVVSVTESAKGIVCMRLDGRPNRIIVDGPSQPTTKGT